MGYSYIHYWQSNSNMKKSSWVAFFVYLHTCVSVFLYFPMLPLYFEVSTRNNRHINKRRIQSKLCLYKYNRLRLEDPRTWREHENCIKSRRKEGRPTTTTTTITILRRSRPIRSKVFFRISNAAKEITTDKPSSNNKSDSTLLVPSDRRLRPRTMLLL
mmetsp:Transcript_9785/g.23932  ORF Transcript_9785/g.23932 Transcript_9785/m.23932 type:complete len:158 (+) Transcript_9785:768-1241(+)